MPAANGKNGSLKYVRWYLENHQEPDEPFTAQNLYRFVEKLDGNYPPGFPKMSIDGSTRYVEPSQPGIENSLNDLTREPDSGVTRTAQNVYVYSPDKADSVTFTLDGKVYEIRRIS